MHKMKELDVVGRTIAILSLVGSLAGCDGYFGVHDGKSKGGEEDSAEKPSKPNHEFLISAFGTEFDTSDEDVGELLQVLQGKAIEAASSHTLLWKHLSKGNVEGFVREYERSQKIIDTISHIYSSGIDRYLSFALQDAHKKTDGVNPAVLDPSAPLRILVKKGLFADAKISLRKFIDARVPLATLHDNVTKSGFGAEIYTRLEDCCTDAEATALAGKLQSFGRNYLKDKGKYLEGSWELGVVFDDETLKAIREGDRHQDHAGKFAQMGYNEQTGLFSFQYMDQKKNDGNVLSEERKFEVFDFREHGVLDGTDARLNGIHPDKLAGVNRKYKELVGKTLDVVKTRYKGEFIE